MSSENAPTGSSRISGALPGSLSNAEEKSFFIETHGCQMNLADSDIVRSVLGTAGYKQCDVLEDADLILTNTCAIRENAEAKVWQRLKYFASLRKKNLKRLREHEKSQNQSQNQDQEQIQGLQDLKELPSNIKPAGYPVVGVLGCMAERLKEQLLDKKEFGVDFIAGPDAYRQLPDLLLAASTDQQAAST